MGIYKNPIKAYFQYQIETKINENQSHLSDGFAMGVVEKARRVSLLIVKLISTFWGFEIGLQTRRLSVPR